MKPREKRVFTPESTYEKVVHMAIERGKFAELLFDKPESLSYRTIARTLSVLEKTAPIKAAAAVRPLRSAFVSAMLSGVKRV